VSPALLAAVLAAAAVGCLVGLPRPGGLRLDAVRVVPAASRGAPPFWLPAAFIVAPAAILLGPVVALLLSAGALALRRTAAVRRRTVARRAERRRAVEACATLAGELRAGRSPAAALTVAAELAGGPSRDVLLSAAAAARLGGDVAGALLPADAPVSGPATAVPEVLRALAACWTVCAASGSGLAAAIDRLEEGLRADQDRRRAVEAELAGPRATAGMLAVLPFAGLLLATGLGADPAHVLLHTPLGLVCLAGGLFLDGLGLLWTGRLVARAGGSG
jgi:tight adherence protein B